MNKSRHQTNSSYWKDSWSKFCRQKVALFSLGILTFIIGSVLFLPLVWDKDPNKIDPTQKSQPPHFGIEALVVTQKRWTAPKQTIFEQTKQAQFLSAPTNVKLVELPNTYSVKLVWDEVKYSSGYQIFRSLHPPQNGRFGIPVARIKQQRGFEDRVNLENKLYYYTIIAVDFFGDLADKYTTYQVTPHYALSLQELAKRELDKYQPGQKIALPAHPLGTDEQGRDILARILYGGRVSLFIGIVAPFLFILFGTLYGAIAGFYGGKIDNYMMRFADFVVALPFLLFMIIFKLLFGIGVGESSVLPMIIALVVLSWPTSARLIRAQALQLREEPYVNASRLLGGSYFYLILRHILPNLLGLILVSLTFAIPGAIFTEAFLSFIGLGVVPPTASWGQMCRDALSNMQSTPHELIFPSIFISLTVLSFNLLGDGLRNAFDSKLDY